MNVLDGYLESNKAFSIKIPVTNNVFSIDMDNRSI